MKSPNPNGRPMGYVTRECLRLVVEAGVHGLSLEEARAALPDQSPNSIKHSLGNLADRGKLAKFVYTRTAVYLLPNFGQEAGKTALQARREAQEIARRERAKESARAYRERYGGAGVKAYKARRKGKADEAARILAEHRAKVEQAKADRLAQKAAEAARKALLHASKRAEISSNNRLARRIKGDGTYEPRRPAPVIVPTIDWGNVKVQKIGHQPGRYEVLTAEPIFTGQPLLPASSCMGRALG